VEERSKYKLSVQTKISINPKNEKNTWNYERSFMFKENYQNFIIKLLCVNFFV
jgi:hypothetical protein